jgi:hypothetical protein
MSRPLFHRKRKHAIVLALFARDTGLDRLYLGDLAGGLVRLLLCGAKLPAGLLEALRLAAMSDQEFDRRYNPRLSPPERIRPIRPIRRLPSAVAVLGALLVVVLLFDLCYLLATH